MLQLQVLASVSCYGSNLASKQCFQNKPDQVASKCFFPPTLGLSTHFQLFRTSKCKHFLAIIKLGQKNPGEADVHSANTNNTEEEACCGLFTETCHTPCIPLVGDYLRGTGLQLVKRVVV